MTMTMLAAITANKLMIFPPRMTLRIMYPGPASFLLVNIIFSDRRLKERNLTVCVGEEVDEEEIDAYAWKMRIFKRRKTIVRYF
jgi:hypothetical protein